MHPCWVVQGISDTEAGPLADFLAMWHARNNRAAEDGVRSKEELLRFRVRLPLPTATFGQCARGVVRWCVWCVGWCVLCAMRVGVCCVLCELLCAWLCGFVAWVFVLCKLLQCCWAVAVLLRVVFVLVVVSVLCAARVGMCCVLCELACAVYCASWCVVCPVWVVVRTVVCHWVVVCYVCGVRCVRCYVCRFAVAVLVVVHLWWMFGVGC